MPVIVGTFLQFKIVQLNYTEVKYGMNMNISFFFSIHFNIQPYNVGKFTFGFWMRV